MKQILYLIFILFLPILCKAQYATSAFKLQNAEVARQFIINKEFTKSSTINISDIPQKEGLSITGEATLDDSICSYISVVLIDKEDNIFLVYENYPILSDNLKDTFENIAIETSIMNAINPKNLRITLVNSSISINNINFLVSNEAQPQLSARIQQLKQKREDYIVKKINTHLKQRNKTWRAGKTSLSSLSYQEKCDMLGEDYSLLGGYEYYKGGIYIISPLIHYKPTIEVNENSPYVQNFDWRNRHGKNWLTPVKSQGGGMCWAFGPISCFEAYINIFFNRKLNMDLSEQEIVSCSDPDIFEEQKGKGGYSDSALAYIRDFGVVEENCFPLKSWTEPCNNKCNSPKDIVSVDNIQFVWGYSEDSIKKALIKTPLLANLYYTTQTVKRWGHTVTFVGYKTITTGDKLQTFVPNENEWITIDSSSPYIGRTAWIIKNNYGDNWGEDGYSYVILDDILKISLYAFTGNVHSKVYDKRTILGIDADDDGYYTWGLGQKPDNIPGWAPIIQDGDDSNPKIGGIDKYGKCIDINPKDHPAMEISKDTMLYRTIIYNNIFINEGATLTLTDEFVMHDDAKITVKSGGTLLIDCCEFQQANIEVLPGGGLTIRNNSKLILSKDDNIDVKLGGECDIKDSEICKL